jgi:hypothetical protein
MVAINASLTGIEVWGLYAFLVVLTCGAFAVVRRTQVADKVAYLQALPVRGSSRTLVVLPELLFVGLVIAAASRWRPGFGPRHALVLWGCCAWAIESAHFFAVSSLGRFALWLAVVGVAPIVSGCAYGHDDVAAAWRRAAIAAVIMAGLGFALTPRSLRRRLARATTEVPTHEPLLSTMGPDSRFRPSNRRVGLARLLWLSMPSQRRWAPGLLAFGALIEVPMLWHAETWHQLSMMFIVWATCFGALVAQATSRGPSEFLATRPLGRSRLLAATVLPWFLLAFVPALLVFMRELSTAPLPAFGAHETSARLALATLAIVFWSGAAPAPAGRFDWVGAATGLVALGLIGWTTAAAVTFGSPRHAFPAPPSWALAALVIPAGAFWYRRSLRRMLALA